MNYKLEMGIKILDAMDSGDLTLLEELFQNKERNIMEVTPVEHWNWLHKALLGFESNKPSSDVINYLINFKDTSSTYWEEVQEAEDYRIFKIINRKDKTEQFFIFTKRSYNIFKIDYKYPTFI